MFETTFFQAAGLFGFGFIISYIASGLYFEYKRRISHKKFDKTKK